MFGIVKFVGELVKTPVDLAADLINIGEFRDTTRTGDRIRKAYRKLDG